MLDHALDADDRPRLQTCNHQPYPRDREDMHPRTHGDGASVWLCLEMELLLAWLGHGKMSAYDRARYLNRTGPRPPALLKRHRGGHDRALCNLDLQVAQKPASRQNKLEFRPRALLTHDFPAIRSSGS